ncbi:glycosyltransferase family 2 protein [Lactobacillus kitasatonis]|uniref:glycosyltransferase family 2 protein n=1 Tax=Lactobacillus kitasatonis TaxID=237446 RepID=UPI0026EB2887|nr:glycosyltransferase family A protein [Lactobacillus kitasatonis]
MSLTRNKGLKEANGDYISFVDSDDYVEPDYVEKMLLTLKSKKVDIVYCSAVVENINGVFI